MTHVCLATDDKCKWPYWVEWLSLLWSCCRSLDLASLRVTISAADALHTGDDREYDAVFAVQEQVRLRAVLYASHVSNVSLSFSDLLDSERERLLDCVCEYTNSLFCLWFLMCDTTPVSQQRFRTLKFYLTPVSKSSWWKGSNRNVSQRIPCASVCPHTASHVVSSMSPVVQAIWWMSSEYHLQTRCTAVSETAV